MADCPAGRLAKQFLLPLRETTGVHQLQIVLADQRLSDFLLDLPSKPGEINALVLDRRAGLILLMLLF